MNQPELILALALAIAFCCGWIAHAGAVAWWQVRRERRAQRIVFAQMAAEDRQKLLAQLERINALRPKHRRIG